MSYVSLARKYRPRRFADMVGQEASSLALTNAISLKREPHSVIFTGVRGIGKTTIARLYAKALNCELGPIAEPCDVCESCLAITQGYHEDVLEIDGASNTGVDDVRALQETLNYVPQRSIYKIYIIDEVHMLSMSAFNALLKTLEEPPSHVIFVFATTELQKVPETIQSRCQIFHLQKIGRLVIADRVRAILVAEQIPFEEAAVFLVAREGRGSLRDSLTVLDQAIAVGGGQVKLETLRLMFGGSQSMPVFRLLEALIMKDVPVILQVISSWDQEGLAIGRLVEETAKACRNSFILRDLKGQAIDLKILELEDREQQSLLELGNKAAALDLNRLFRQLTKCLDDLRHADLDRFVLENYCLEWCFDPGIVDLQTLHTLLSGGNLVSSVQTSATARVTSPTESTAVNLRERWKSSAVQSIVDVKPADVRLEAKSSEIKYSHSVEIGVNPAGAPQAPNVGIRSNGAVHAPNFLASPGVAEVQSFSSFVQIDVSRPIGAESEKRVVKDEEQPNPGALTALNAELPNTQKQDEPLSPLKKLQQMEPQSFTKQMAVRDVKPPVSTFEQVQAPMSAPTFPSEWRVFVDEWKKQKPLQGRILEEAYVLEYSQQRIKLAVEAQSMAGGKLLQQDVRKRLLEQFAQLFGFQGQLEVTIRNDVASLNEPGLTVSEAQGENLLAVKSREREVAREKLRHRVESHPMTREVISQFGGTIEQIELH